MNLTHVLNLTHVPTGGCDEGRATACFFSIKHAAGEEEVRHMLVSDACCV